MPFLELINEVPYEFYQVNGTKYYKNYNPCPDEVQQKLDQCAGEMFLSRIPTNITAEQIAIVASQLGELYVLRFKVNFAGLSRGFAYLQYLNPDLMDYAIETLPRLFIENHLGNIHVRRSKNTSSLVVRNITGMAPDEVLAILDKMCNNYSECNFKYASSNTLECKLVFGSNEDAVKARRNLIGEIHIFGFAATIGWEFCAK